MKNRKPLPLNAIRAFEAAARLGRLGTAAEELSVTHGAISRQVRQLELFLGLELFEGPRSKPRLSKAGAELGPSLTLALEQIHAAVRTLQTQDDGVLQVSCLGTFAMRWLIPRLHRFAALHPNIDLRLNTDGKSSDTQRRRFDVTIAAIGHTGNLAEGETLLFPERLGLVLAPALLPRKRKPTASELTAVPRLAVKTRANAWSAWDKLTASSARRQNVRVATVYEHYYFAIEAAMSGLGACVVPLHLVANDIRQGRLAAPLGFKDSGYRYVARSSDPTDRKSKLFTTWLVSEVKAETVE